MIFSPSTYLIGVLLVLVQVLAALPWVVLSFFSRDDRAAWRRQPFAASFVKGYALAAAVVFVVPFLLPFLVKDSGALEICGQAYAAILQLQLLADFFIALFAVLLPLWPKGGAIALAAFREGIRQPMFWLLFVLAFALMFISVFIPYFTFGEDHLVVKDLGYDTIMLFAAIFGALAASMSVSEEIEGRTAITLMSKPVSRRQFLIGKFLGIILAAGVFFALLGMWFEGMSLLKPWWDRADKPWWAAENAPTMPAPPWVMALLNRWELSNVTTDLLRGIGLWTHLILDVAPGLILGFSQVMVLVAIAVALATRVPMVVNLVAVVVLFFLAHLTPVLVAIGYQAQLTDPGSAVSQLLAFIARLFDTLLPDLDLFRFDPALLSDTPLPAGPFVRFLGSVSLYGLLYTSIVLLFGLILFEDRDLA